MRENMEKWKVIKLTRKDTDLVEGEKGKSLKESKKDRRLHCDLMDWGCSSPSWGG